MKLVFTPLFLLLSMACSDPQEAIVPEKVSEVQGNKFDIQVGEMVLNTSHELLISVQKVEDSRCPIGLQCIWSGEVSTFVTLHTKKSPVKSVDLSLCLGCLNDNDSVQFELGNRKYRMILKDVKPYPEYGKPETMRYKKPEFALEVL